APGEVVRDVRRPRFAHLRRPRPPAAPGRPPLRFEECLGRGPHAMSLSIGLDTAVKALRAHQLAVDVASHNIANANTPGFSRQRVILRPEGLMASSRDSHDGLLGK